MPNASPEALAVSSQFFFLIPLAVRFVEIHSF
jgi:hypothetical protein